MSSPDQPNQHTPVEQPNNLISNSRVKILDLLCEGPIVGFTPQSGIYGNDPLTSVYFDDVQVRNLDGSYNFNSSGKGFNFSYTSGTPNQLAIPGFQNVENIIPLSSNTKIAYPPSGTGPFKTVVASINTDTYPDADSIKVTIRIPSLLSQDIKNGDTNGYSLGYAVAISLNDGPFVDTRSTTIGGKCTAPYMYTTNHVLPKTVPPQNYYSWKVKVWRTTMNIPSITVQNESYVDSICVVSSSSFSYPNTALAALELSADQFSTIPARAYDLMGLLISVPNGYTPTTFNTDNTITPSIYPNIWDGSWDTNKKWTNNPAFILYDLMTNKRYGLGNHIKDSWIDKWTLYEIAQYCDEMVSDGNGGLEPRFTCNIVLQQRTDAYNLLLNLSSIFRGMMYWSNGRIFTTNTNNKSPVYNFTNANVINGQFNYSDTAKNTRSTIIKVRWTNPNNLYRESIEYIEDTNGILKYGYVQKDITAFACTSQGQARRIGSWVLQTEQLLTETISFQAGIEGNYIRPGDVFNVFDNFRNNRQQGGRLKSLNGTNLELDRPVDLVTGCIYSLSVINPKFNFESTGSLTGSDQIPLIRNSQIEAKLVTTSAGSGISQLTVNGAYSTAGNGSIWLLAISGIAPSIFQQPTSYKCLATSEVDGNVEILGLNYQTGINYVIETGYSIITQPINSGDRTSINPPSNLIINQITGLQVNNRFYSYFKLSWTDTTSSNLAYYDVSGQSFGGAWENVAKPQAPAASYDIINTGRYNFKVNAISNGGVSSSYISGFDTVLSTNPLLYPPRLSELYLSDNYDPNLKNQSGYYTGYLGKSPKFDWKLPLDENGLITAQAQFLSGYKLHILDPITNYELITPKIIPRNAPSYQMDASTFASFANGEQRNIKIYVECFDLYGGTISGGSLIVNNQSPTTNNTISNFYSDNSNLHYNITPNYNDIQDISGVYIWYNTNLITPDFNNYNFVSDNFAGVINTNITTSYYAWWSPIDTFGRSGCQISSPISVIPTNTATSTGVLAAFSGLSGALSQNLTNSINTVNNTFAQINATISGISGLTGLAALQSQITGEQYLRQSGDTAEATVRSLAVINLGNTISGVSGLVTSAITNEATLRISGLNSEANTRSLAIAQILGAVSGLSGVTGQAGFATVGYVDAETNARVSSMSAEASMRNNVVAQLTGIVNSLSGYTESKASTAYVSTAITTLTNSGSSEANTRNLAVANLNTKVTSLSGYTDSKASTAYVDAETTNRVSAVSAEASMRNTVAAQITGFVLNVSGGERTFSQASINSVSNTLTTNINTVANNLSTTNATLNGVSATTQLLSDAFITGGKAVARWGMQVNADGAIAGIQAIASNGMNPISAVKVLANIFQVQSNINGVITNPFTINSSTNAITIGVDIMSDNYVANSAGYKLTRSNGSAEFAGNLTVGVGYNKFEWKNNKINIMSSDVYGNTFILDPGYLQLSMSGSSAYLNATNPPVLALNGDDAYANFQNIGIYSYRFSDNSRYSINHDSIGVGGTTASNILLDGTNFRFKIAGNILIDNQTLNFTANVGHKIADHTMGYGSIELGGSSAGDRNCFIDFHSDDTHGDFSARIIRTPGIDGSFNIMNIGAGALILGANNINLVYLTSLGAGVSRLSIALPTSSAGLGANALWRNGNTVMITS